MHKKIVKSHLHGHPLVGDFRQLVFAGDDDIFVNLLFEALFVVRPQIEPQRLRLPRQNKQQANDTEKIARNIHFERSYWKTANKNFLKLVRNLFPPLENYFVFSGLSSKCESLPRILP